MTRTITWKTTKPPKNRRILVTVISPEGWAEIYAVQIAKKAPGNPGTQLQDYTGDTIGYHSTNIKCWAEIDDLLPRF